MPELPEVQTTVNGINKRAKGLVIKDVWTDYNSSFYLGKEDIKNPKYFSKFKKETARAKILNTTRRGKNVLIHLSNGKTILIHMKMTGHLLYGTYKKCPTINNKLVTDNQKKEEWVAEEKNIQDDSYNRFVHLVFTLSNSKSLALSDMRKFAKVTLIDTKTLHESPHLRFHGPEPLDNNFTFEKFKERVVLRPNTPIKTVLMDPSIIAGIGNIYSDELLWRAGIHPLEKPKNISNKKLGLAYNAMRKVLELGLDFGGASFSDYRNIDGKHGRFQETHQVYGRKGEKCKKSGCGGVILRIVVGGRSAHFCSKHQKIVRRGS